MKFATEINKHADGKIIRRSSMGDILMNDANEAVINTTTPSTSTGLVAGTASDKSNEVKAVEKFITITQSAGSASERVTQMNKNKITNVNDADAKKSGTPSNTGNNAKNAPVVFTVTKQQQKQNTQKNPKAAGVYGLLLKCCFGLCVVLLSKFLHCLLLALHVFFFVDKFYHHAFVFVLVLILLHLLLHQNFEVQN